MLSTKLLDKYENDRNTFNKRPGNYIDDRLLNEQYNTIMSKYVKKMPCIDYEISHNENQDGGSINELNDKIRSLADKQIDDHKHIIETISRKKKRIVMSNLIGKKSNIDHLINDERSYINYIADNIKANVKDDLAVVIITQHNDTVDVDIDNADIFVNKLPDKDYKKTNIIFALHIKVKEFRTNFKYFNAMIAHIHNNNIVNGGNLFIYCAHDAQHKEYNDLCRLMNQCYDSQSFLFKKVMFDMNIRGVMCLINKTHHIKDATGLSPIDIIIDIENEYMEEMLLHMKYLLTYTSRQTQYYSYIIRILLDSDIDERRFIMATIESLYSTR